MPYFSVIIPSFNRAPNCKECYSSFFISLLYKSLKVVTFKECNPQKLQLLRNVKLKNGTFVFYLIRYGRKST